MEAFFYFCLIMFTPAAFGILYGLSKYEPLTAIFFVLTTIAVTYIRHIHYIMVWRKDVESWKQRGSRAASPMYYFKFTTLFESFSACALPFGGYLLSECGTSICY